MNFSFIFSESKFMNFVMIKDKDSKRKALKEKSILTTNVIDKSSDEKSSRKETTQNTQRSLPLLLPKISSSNKKGKFQSIVSSSLQDVVIVTPPYRQESVHGLEGVKKYIQ